MTIVEQLCGTECPSSTQIAAKRAEIFEAERVLRDRLKALEQQRRSLLVEGEPEQLIEHDDVVRRLTAEADQLASRSDLLHSEWKRQVVHEEIARAPQLLEDLEKAMNDAAEAFQVFNAAKRRAIALAVTQNRVWDSAGPSAYDLPEVPRRLAARVEALQGEGAPRLRPTPVREDGRRAIIHVDAPVEFVGPWTEAQKRAWFSQHHRSVPAGVLVGGPR